MISNENNSGYCISALIDSYLQEMIIIYQLMIVPKSQNIESNMKLCIQLMFTLIHYACTHV